MKFTHALARLPADSAVRGLTSAGLGAPDMQQMRAQHRDYLRILESIGLEVSLMQPDDHFPDSCFVEDTAVVTQSIGIITRPGAVSRRGEEQAVEPWLATHRPIEHIVAPGTVDGGDVLVTGERVLIGLSARTNAKGAGQLAEILEAEGMRCIKLPAGNALHLKSSVNELGDDRLLVTPDFADCAELRNFECTVVPAEESYAGNSLWINGRVVVPTGFAKTRKLIDALGIETIEADVSEFRKLDGGLSCLSIRL
jgi:dimethylargininase